MSWCLFIASVPRFIKVLKLGGAQLLVNAVWVIGCDAPCSRVKGLQFL
jgi:hypothetical protein